MSATGRNLIPLAVYKHSVSSCFSSAGAPAISDHSFCLGLFSIQNYLIAKPITRLISCELYNYNVWPVMLYSLIFLDVRTLYTHRNVFAQARNVVVVIFCFFQYSPALPVSILHFHLTIKPRIPLCLSVCCLYISRNIHLTYFIFGRCLAEDPSQCNVQFGALLAWGNIWFYYIFNLQRSPICAAVWAWPQKSNYWWLNRFKIPDHPTFLSFTPTFLSVNGWTIIRQHVWMSERTDSFMMSFLM